MPSAAGKRQRARSSSHSQSQNGTYDSEAHQPQTSRRRRERGNGSHNDSRQDPQEKEEVVHLGSRTNVPHFRPGNIKKLEMTNFLTFSKTVFNPGPRMNLVIGPNGTGKSTIVSAVCIVFAGKPNILGRNPDLGAFVKYGTQQASVKAWIHEPNAENNCIKVHRDFDINGNNEFYINDRRVKQRDVLEQIVMKYDIQLDNLSQFMPQEKVAEFTNHKPEELLKLAIKSLGGSEKEHEYFQLMEEDTKLTSHTDNLHKNKTQLQKLLTEQQNDQEEVEQYRQQQVLKDRLDLLKRLKPILEEIATRFAYKKVRDEYKRFDSELQILTQEFQSKLASTMQAKKQNVNVSKSKLNHLTTSFHALDEKYQHLIGKLDSVATNLSTKISELKNVKANSEKAKESVQLAKQKLRQAEDQYAQVSQMSDSELAAKFQHLQAKQQDLRSSRRTTGRELQPLEHEKQAIHRTINYVGTKLKGLQDVKQQRMNRLRQKRDGEMILKVAQLIDHMKAQNAFEHEVYGPVSIEIEVNNDYHARILEHAVSGWLSTAFVFESMRDTRKLLEECRKRFNGYKPDTMTTPTTRDDEIDHNMINRQVPPLPINEDLRRLGIDCVVSEIFKAPDSVKAALNAQAGLHNVYVGSHEALTNQEILRNQVELPAWYTPESRCQLSKSQFNRNARNLKVDSGFMYVEGKAYKDGTIDTTREKERHMSQLRAEEDKLQQLNHKMEQLNMELQRIDREVSSYNPELRDIAEKRKEIREKSDDVDRIRQYVENQERRAAAKNEELLRKNLSREVSELEKQVMDILYEQNDIVKEVNNRLLKIEEAAVNKLCAEGEYSAEMGKHEEARNILEDKKRALDEKKIERDHIKEDWRQKKDFASSVMTEAEVKRNSDTLVKYMDDGRFLLELLDNDIENLEGEIEGLSASGSGIIEQYELRERKIRTLQREIGEQEEWFAKRHGSLIDRKEAFLTWLNNGINRMRVKFSELYRRLGCSGDIRLTNIDVENNNTNNGQNIVNSNSLKDLTLQVLVSYRHDVELRPVSAQANSGGEKMCCTMIFCFSLQVEEERIPPFIMVDELNQGLDPTNEMKIMTMMIEDAGTQNGPQSFVVTPKLLSNLPLSSCTKTHIIFNGPVKGKGELID